MTGNFAWLNALTIVLAVSTVSDGLLSTVLPVGSPSVAPVPLPLLVASVGLAALVAVLSVRPVRVDERPPQWAPYHLRLDRQLWFTAMRPRPGRRQRWFRCSGTSARATTRCAGCSGPIRSTVTLRN